MLKHTIRDKHNKDIEVETSPMKAIRLKCLDCTCFSQKEVKLCVITNCPLHPYRFGKNPGRPKRVYTEEERQVIRDRFAEMRAKKQSIAKDNG